MNRWQQHRLHTNQQYGHKENPAISPRLVLPWVLVCLPQAIHTISESPSHDQVRGPVLVSEYLGLQATSDEAAVIDRVLLNRLHWTAIRGEAQRAFNVRLKAHDLRTSAWKVGENPVDRLLGKELCVLAWAVEHLELSKIPVAVRNWLALRPEERWWLFGMTSICTGAVGDGEKGWRLALRHALGDVAHSDLLQPKGSRQRIERHDKRTTLDLFDSE